ncbi:MAG: carbamoyl phosphate synthase small subunit [Deltaproteobacteria bacterium CG23_combo_of_CG06-09_8_20_14_all_51_20]|nr:glutamine-hydrolyzing carbamoyl-phosphate synthase small subunit [Deltaproteobacteria bacterium]NCP08828.1 glutamine-hydrolyzing carbamoyl-phosphate synthase small subunit [bacterium]OIP39197.1 MAG: carbamoyl phosphate synthase small subunit [Desulfobacteraceae bacterium CG2_30_51_40]PIP47037.1 MAG: carbamoyl phosphate synthase small subunit [Deltaproteobacteria bacterium CG23_combo_of_CG06-09_8_20_14_all_51_20]PIY25091.1 MAG: carbamoyl phosphate synthase small subunit [Deltaproteobacteria b
MCRAILVLEDGAVFEGRSFTGDCETTGEVVFNTSMAGYQEILTDPSYCGQMVTMTYPLIGNYGINFMDVESERIQVRALLVREYHESPSNWRSEGSLASYLRTSGIPGVEGLDTRALTRHIRLRGAMKAALSTRDLDRDSLIEKARFAPDMNGLDLVKEVTCKKPMLWRDGQMVALESGLERFVWPKTGRFKVAALDYGIKYNILRSLEKRGCDVIVLPAHLAWQDVERLEPDGIFLSNGPGDPAAVGYAIENIKALIGKKPMFGICLGHQLVGIALGAKTFKLKFGHRGANQPVKNLKNGKIEITSQNHGFCVELESLNNPSVELSHINLNDGTVEGLIHKDIPLFSVQYHPEASPGPHDAAYLFERFTEMMRLFKDKKRR